jgi:hypothetical protein
LEAKTDAHFRQMFEATRQLMTPIEMNKRAIGL